jgi:hypothetical protein
MAHYNNVPTHRTYTKIIDTSPKSQVDGALIAHAFGASAKYVLSASDPVVFRDVVKAFLDPNIKTLRE